MSSLVLPAAVLETAAAGATFRTFSDGSTIIHHLGTVRSLPIVVSGTVRVLRTDTDGRELLIYHVKPGECCVISYLCGLHQEQSSVKAVAAGEVELMLVPMERMSTLLREHPMMLDYLLHTYHARITELLNVVTTLAFGTMDERLLKLLQSKAEMLGVPEIKTTHQQLAHEMGTAREVVSRTLKQLEQKQVLRMGRNKVTLC